MKKTNYISVLKESLMEADTTKTSDILGPMVEPILGYDGNGELKTHKSASDILQKYYFEGEGNEGESVIKVDDPDTVTSGEKDQSKIDGVKKRVEEVITSTTMTDKPTEKTLKEMVVDLEDILLDESESIDDDMASNLESLLEMDDIDDDMEYRLEAALTKDEKDEELDDADGASDDVVIDKDSKVKLEAVLNEEDDNAIETKDEVDDEDGKKSEDEEDEENPLDVDDELKESDFETKLSNILNEDIMSDNETLIDNIEEILGEQVSVSADIAGIDSPFTDEKSDEDIDVDNPMHSKVTTEGIEDSVLEWLIMEIEDTDMLDSDDLLEDEEIDSDGLLEDEVIDEFKVSKIKSKKIRV